MAGAHRKKVFERFRFCVVSAKWILSKEVVMAYKEATEKAGILTKPVIYMPEEGLGA
jgi:hypothetical protein